MRKILLVVALVGVLLCICVAGWQSRLNILPQVVASHLPGKSEKYPDLALDGLTPLQRKIIDITRLEYQGQPNYTKYSEGNREAWCADFVSWVYKTAGVPFTNPNSGSWRIPGTYTLRDYLTGEGRLRSRESNYSPKTGDLMLYDNPNSFGQHVNIVLQVNKDGSITTIGGNEPGGIRVKTHRANGESGFVGYGILK